ncbi:MAG: RidA family protein [Anaerolineales bacterium]
MTKRIVIKPYDTYDVSTFVIHGVTVYIGHFGGSYDDNGNKLLAVEEQTIQTFKNLERAFQEINLSLKDLLKVTVILRDITDFNAMHEAWKKVFSDEYPVRTTITSNFVDDHCRIQIEGIAGLKSS